MPPCDQLSDPLEAHLPHCLCQRRVLPDTTPLSPRLPLSDPSREPVLEAIQGPLHPWGEDPHIHPEQQHRLPHHFIKTSRHLRIFPLPDQYPRLPPPTVSRFPKVPYHRKPVIASCRQHPSQVSKCREILQRHPIGLEGSLRALPHLRLRNPTPLPLRSFGTLGCSRVPDIQDALGDQHV